MKTITSLIVGTALAGGSPGWAAESVKDSALQRALFGAPAAEMPAKAADIVKTARPGDRGFITVSMVKTAISINPVSSAPVVNAIARAVPEMASIAAGAAAEEQPAKAAEIAKAAAGAAPARAGKIVVAVCRAAPRQYRDTSISVAEAAPGSGLEVLRAVAAAFPELKSGIDHALAGHQGAAPSVPAVLAAARQSPTLLPDNRSSTLASTIGSPTPTGSPADRSPTVAGPLAPLSDSSGSPDVSQPQPRPHGGRNYAAP
jgi:hypothetical protein